MAIQLSVRVRNARLDAIETTMGASPTMRIRSGAPPANVAATRTGTVLATLALPADWMSDAANGAKSMLGTWADNEADAAGTAGHYEIVGAGGVVDMQGTVTASGGGGDLEVNNTIFAQGQPFSVTAFTLNEQNS
jgi:hypothetical protein